MNKLIIVLLLPLFHSGEAINCYHCNSEPSDYGWWDPDCAEEGYEGHRQEEPTAFSCYTDLYENGEVWRRSYDPEHHLEGDCVEDTEFNLNEEEVHYCRCYCDTDLCNNINNYWCSSGPPVPTIPTTTPTTPPTIPTTTPTTPPTIPTTTPTTPPTIPTTTPTTPPTIPTTTPTTPPTIPTTTPTTPPTISTTTPTTPPTIPTTTTVDPLKGLTCYSCWDCPTVDEETNTSGGENGKKFLSCTLTGDREDGDATIIRGGDYEQHEDGLCVYIADDYTCFCNTELCNSEPAY